MSTWVIDLPGVLPMSMNERERCSYWKRKKELDELIDTIGWIAAAERIPQAAKRRFVRISIHKTTRSRALDDPSNLHARAKAPLDALVRLGLLTNDNHAGLDWGGVVEGPREQSKRTSILISDLSSAELVDDTIRAITTGDAA